MKPKLTTTEAIAPNDVMQARATYRGYTVATFSSTGFESLADVLRAVRCAAGSVVGFVTISLRNATRGWSQERALFIKPPAPGVQLHLM